MGGPWPPRVGCLVGGAELRVDTGDERGGGRVGIERNEFAEGELEAAREGRAGQPRVAFAGHERAGADVDKLERGAGAAGDEGEAGAERVELGARNGAGAFGEDEERAARGDAFGGAADAVHAGVAGDVAAEEGGGADGGVAQEGGLEDADGIGEAGEQEERVDESRVVDDVDHAARERTVEAVEDHVDNAGEMHPAKPEIEHPAGGGAGARAEAFAAGQEEEGRAAEVEHQTAEAEEQPGEVVGQREPEAAEERHF